MFHNRFFVRDLLEHPLLLQNLVVPPVIEERSGDPHAFGVIQLTLLIVLHHHRGGCTLRSSVGHVDF